MGALEDKLYILHGWAPITDRWNPFLEALKAQKIIPVMLPIPGLSAPIDRPWTLDDYVEWLYKEVKDENKISLLGHSNGGRIALAFTHKYPDEVGQLFLLDSAGIYHNDLGTKIKRSVFKTIASIGKRVVNSDKARSAMYSLTGESDYKNATPIMRETMKNLISTDLLPKLQDIKTPTVIIWGKDDAVTPYEDALVLRQGLPNSKLFDVVGARHSPQFTHIPEVVKIIKENLI